MDLSVYSSMLSVTAKTERRREGKKFRQYLAAIAGKLALFYSLSARWVRLHYFHSLCIYYYDGSPRGVHSAAQHSVVEWCYLIIDFFSLRNIFKYYIELIEKKANVVNLI